MTDKINILFHYEDRSIEYVVDINTHKLNKLVDDTLNTFDTVLRNIVSLDKFGEVYDDINESEKVVIDDVLDGLKNE